MRPPHVRVTGLTKAFGGSRALSNVDLVIEQGTVHCLIGENGAGKSTLGRVLAGLHRPDAGTIEVLGREVSFRSPADALAAGIAGMAQEVALVPAMSVSDNVLLGVEPSVAGFIGQRRQREQVRALVASHGFQLDPDARVADLRIADQQKVEVLKAIARGSRLVVMDEPTASLGDHDAGTLLDMVRRLRDHGVSVVYISHHLDEVLALADRVTVLRNGEVVYDGLPVSKPDLVLHMLGRPLEASFPERTVPDPGAPVLIETDGLALDGSFGPISLKVRAGEILGLAGLVGSGRTALARVLAGVERPTAGTIYLRGHARRFRSPAAAIRAGVHFIPEDRKRQGLVLVRPTRENITYPLLRQLSRATVIRRRAERDAAALASERTDVRAAGLDAPVWTLSGGNQQKTMFARSSLAQPDVLIVDEPTKGVDVGAKLAIHRLISEFAASGLAVLLISSEHEEVMGLAHRILVLSEGQAIAEFAGPDFPAEEITRTIVTGRTERIR